MARGGGYAGAASPPSVWMEVPGIVVGTLGLLLMNLVRVVSLFFVGIHFPSRSR